MKREKKRARFWCQIYFSQFFTLMIETFATSKTRNIFASDWKSRKFCDINFRE